jgi:hypothetical protein
MTVTALEYLLAITGLITLALACWALGDSCRERRVLVRADVNGLKWATVAGHVSRDLARVVAAFVLAVAGIWLLALPNDQDVPTMVSKSALLALGWLLSFSVFADRIMRERIRHHLDRLP